MQKVENLATKGKGLDAECFPFCSAAKVAEKDATNLGQKLAVKDALKG